MTAFRTLSAHEASAFLRANGVKRKLPHAMTKRLCHWVVCGHCGLVALKNDVSVRAMRRSCEVEE